MVFSEDGAAGPRRRPPRRALPGRVWDATRCPGDKRRQNRDDPGIWISLLLLVLSPVTVQLLRVSEVNGDKRIFKNKVDQANALERGLLTKWPVLTYAGTKAKCFSSERRVNRMKRALSSKLCGFYVHVRPSRGSAALSITLVF